MYVETEQPGRAERPTGNAERQPGSFGNQQAETGENRKSAGRGAWPSYRGTGMAGIYGEYADTLQKVMDQLIGELSDYNNEVREKTGDGIYEHLLGRIKSEESMREKCDRRGVPQTPESALRVMTDSIGLRVITRFIDDIYVFEKASGCHDCAGEGLYPACQAEWVPELSCHPGQGGAVSGHRWQTAGPLLYRSAAANHRDGFVGESGASAQV